MNRNQSQLSDGRVLPIAWISTALDDLPISSEAFRVYFHLLRRVGKNDKAWPSYRSIGCHCFPSMKEESARSKAIRSVKELVEWNLIRVENVQTNQGFHSNHYYITNDSEWKDPSDVISPPSDVISLNKDLPYKDIQIKDYQGKIKSPLTPQGEVVEKNFVDNGFEIQDASEEDAIANPLPTQKTQNQPLVQTEIHPQRINVPAIENDSRFVASDPMAENTEARGAIAKTGAMQGSSCIDPGFLEFYRLFLNGCDAYKKRGRECTTHHAKSSLGKLWRDDPLRILGEIENWQKSQATTAQYPDTQNIDEIPEDELDAILKAIENKILLKEQQNNANN